MDYITQPGTIPHRVIEYLKTLPPGTAVSGAELADKIGHEGLPLRDYLKTALEHGAIFTEKRTPQGSSQPRIYWSLGDGQPLPKPEDYEPDEPLHKMTPAKKTATAPQPARTTQEAQLPLFGAFSDGSISISHGENQIHLKATAAEELRRFLMKVWG